MSWFSTVFHLHRKQQTANGSRPQGHTPVCVVLHVLGLTHLPASCIGLRVADTLGGALRVADTLGWYIVRVPWVPKMGPVDCAMAGTENMKVELGTAHPNTYNKKSPFALSESKGATCSESNPGYWAPRAGTITGSPTGKMDSSLVRAMGPEIGPLRGCAPRPGVLERSDYRQNIRG